MQILQQKLLLKYKYQIATETAGQNTSKQLSAKGTALQNGISTYYYYYFLKWSECRETELRKWDKGILGLQWS